MTLRRKIMIITPFITFILFIVLRYVLKELGMHDKLKWTYLVYLINLTIPFLIGEWKINFSYPLVMVVLYLLLGFCFNLWHPGWVVFVTIPIYYTLKSPTAKKVKINDKGEFIDE